tara:strand:+ start:349 stop:549 length:201 start_codon:yes stop_codon:yes gene_type:complete
LGAHILAKNSDKTRAYIKKTPENRGFFVWHDECLRDGRIVNRVTAGELELEHRQRHTTQQYGEIRE